MPPLPPEREQEVRSSLRPLVFRLATPVAGIAIGVLIGWLLLRLV